MRRTRSGKRIPRYTGLPPLSFSPHFPRRFSFFSCASFFPPSSLFFLLSLSNSTPRPSSAPPLKRTRNRRGMDGERGRERVVPPPLLRSPRPLAPNKRTRLRDTRQAYRHGKQEHFTTTILAECKTCLKGDIKNEYVRVSSVASSICFPLPLSFLPPLRPSSFFLISSLASLYSRLSDSSLFSLSLFLFRSVGRAKRSCLRKEERPSSLPCAGNGTGVETGLEVVRSRDSRFSFPSKEKEARDLFSR